MKNKILIMGEGFVGSRIRQELDAEICAKKITSLDDALAEVNTYKPKILINCIGFIGRNVDDCESNKEKAMTANVFVPALLAEAALRSNSRLIHISSGCIYHYSYDRGSPIPESRDPDFFELFYSRTKIYAEQMLKILSLHYPVLITRIRIPLDNRPHSRNILTKLINYNRVIDLPNSVTYIPDFIKALKHLIKIQATGIYNVVNKGAMAYPQLLDVYKKYVPDFKYQVVDFKKLGLTRTNLILSTRKLESSGFKIRKINEVIEECVKEYVKY